MGMIRRFGRNKDQRFDAAAVKALVDLVYLEYPRRDSLEEIASVYLMSDEAARALRDVDEWLAADGEPGAP